MAIAAEELEGGAAASAADGRGASSQRLVEGARSAPGAVYQRVGSPSALSGTLTRLIWAVAIGLIVLEIASEATGQFWSFNLGAPWAQNALRKQPYQPLFGAAPASSALPGVFGGTVPAPSLLKPNPGQGGI